MKEYKYETFIPKKFVIGLDKSQHGFPTMKRENGNWTNVSVFEKHCGYKPYTQKDARIEISKGLSLKVKEIENVPTKGFKLVNAHKCVYRTNLFENVSCAMLHDPRGWEISIESKVLQSLLESNGFNLVNGELVNVELMYCWPKHSSIPFSVVVADHHAKKIQDETHKYVTIRDAVQSLKPSELVPGKVYSSQTSKLCGHLYMYLGKHDVYSAEVQSRAVAKGDYTHVQRFIERRDDITGKDKHVFYCIDADRTNYNITLNYPGKSPYYVTNNVSKLFDTCEDVDLTKFTMHDDLTKQCTLENIKDDMSKNALFNMIDFTKTHDTLVDYQAFEDVFGFLKGYNFVEGQLKAFPFYDYADGIFLWTENGVYVKKLDRWGTIVEQPSSFKDFTIRSYSDSVCNRYYYDVKSPRVAHSSWYSSDSENYKRYSCSNDIASKQAMVKKMFDELKPTWKQFVFCNGSDVPPNQNMQLNKHDRHYE